MDGIHSGLGLIEWVPSAVTGVMLLTVLVLNRKAQAERAQLGRDLVLSRRSSPWRSPSRKFTCPCCGYRTLSEFPGSFESCEICFWEDDPSQLLDPADGDGANGLSLMECQANFARFGACEPRCVDKVRAPRADEVRDAAWRPANAADLSRAQALRDSSDADFNKLETWYYWTRAAD